MKRHPLITPLLQILIFFTGSISRADRIVSAESLDRDYRTRTEAEGPCLECSEAEARPMRIPNWYEELSQLFKIEKTYRPDGPNSPDWLNYKDVIPQVVRPVGLISVDRVNESGRPTTGRATAFLVNNECYVITSAHVVLNEGEQSLARLAQISIIGGEAGGDFRGYLAELVAQVNQTLSLEDRQTVVSMRTHDDRQIELRRRRFDVRLKDAKGLATTYPVREVLDLNPDQDVALLSLDRDDCNEKKYGHYDLNDVIQFRKILGKLAKGSVMNVAYIGDRSKDIMSVNTCKGTDMPDTTTAVFHICPTLGGSSGSPLLVVVHPDGSPFTRRERQSDGSYKEVTYMPSPEELDRMKNSRGEGFQLGRDYLAIPIGIHANGGFLDEGVEHEIVDPVTGKVTSRRANFAYSIFAAVGFSNFHRRIAEDIQRRESSRLAKPGDRSRPTQPVKQSTLLPSSGRRI